MTTEHPGFRLTRTDSVLRLTLCRPERRNVQTPSMWLAMAEVARTLPADVRVVVIDAEGPDFSAGLDRVMLGAEVPKGEPKMLSIAANRGPAETARLIATFQQAFTAWGECDAIVVAAVQGNAIGAGFQLALAADLRVVAADAKLSLRETSLGLVPDLGGTLPLVRTVGYSRALEVCLTGRAIEAQEAVAAGLATIVAPNDRLGAVTDAVVEAVLESPESAVRAIKKVLREAVTNDPAGQLLTERTAQAELLVELVGGWNKPMDDHHDHDHGDHDHAH
ncbi:enoyl-CoA hydratase/isomerase family protein [Mariniluteicoccus flavus]